MLFGPNILFACDVMRVLTVLTLLLLIGCDKGSKMADSDRYIPAPRQPPAHSFTKLPSGPFEVGTQEYLAIVPKLVRYRDWGPNGPEDSPAWRDENKFAGWLERQAVPRSFAEFLYQNAPERNLMVNAGYLKGVGDLIERNSDARCRQVRAAGFFIVGSGPNGDFLVVDLEHEGATGFLPLELVFSKSSPELRALFIPVAPSLGKYLALSEQSTETPRDYWASTEWIKQKKSEQNGSANEAAPHR